MIFQPKIKVSDLDDLTQVLYQEANEEITKVVENCIETEMVNFPAYYYYYYGLMVTSKYRFQRSQTEYEEAKSEFLNSKRAGSIKLSVAAGEDLANAQSSLRELHKLATNRELIYAFMKGICNTLEHKKDMLVQLSANKRQEIKINQ
tara:strand:+ start:90811 stop:91251 length:441 start_codon:yes stop_codon:yes gene_type:complete